MSFQKIKKMIQGVLEQLPPQATSRMPKQNEKLDFFQYTIVKFQSAIYVSVPQYLSFRI